MTFLTFYLFLKTDVIVPSESNKQKTLKKILFFIGILSATDEKGRLRIRIRESVDPSQNVPDP
jgi:hypothetical protein